MTDEGVPTAPTTTLLPDERADDLVFRPGWTRLDDAPIAGRTDAAVSVDDRLFIFGGWEDECPPWANCIGPSDPPLADGAIVDLRTGEWDTLPLPADRGYFQLSPYAGGVVAVSRSDERGEISDFWFDASNGSWSTLPESGTNGFQVWRSGDRLYLNPHFGLNAEGGMFDPVSNEWAALPDVPDADKPTGQRIVKRFPSFTISAHSSNRNRAEPLLRRLLRTTAAKSKTT